MNAMPPVSHTTTAQLTASAPRASKIRETRGREWDAMDHVSAGLVTDLPAASEYVRIAARSRRRGLLTC